MKSALKYTYSSASQIGGVLE
uniref:Uncharacterized protein n=1 Tax=Arundo donax TaxID=35708 RepID=A0A0A9F1U6_ARUDO